MAKVIHIKIPEVTPDTTPLADLIEILKNLNKALVEGSTPDLVGSSAPAISLVSISKGSNDLAFRLEDHYAGEYSKIVHRVKGREFNKLPQIQHEALTDLSRFLTRKGWSVLMPNPDGTEPIEISGQYQIPPFETRLNIKGLTELFGKCIRVGGVEPTIRLRLSNGESITAETNAIVAKKVAQHLYEDVSLTGEANWDVESLKLISFNVFDLKTFSLPSPAVAFKELREIIGNAFDGIDAVRFVHELRYEEEEV